MNLFELNWCWYEDYRFYLFTHDNKTEEQFKEDVRFLLRKYGKDYLETARHEDGDMLVGASDWIDFISTKMPELGYSPIDPIRESFFGSYIIDGERDDDENWREVVGDELADLAIEHNKKVRKEMYHEKEYDNEDK
jgi:hypothetical protein